MKLPMLNSHYDYLAPGVSYLIVYSMIPNNLKILEL
jgi:hypothetical protein